MNFEFSRDQQNALEQVALWMKSPAPIFKIGGLAGTGKSVLVQKIQSTYGASVCAFTGKAAYVLKRKGVEDPKTMHRLIYQPVKMCLFCKRQQGICECIVPEFKLKFLKVSALPHRLVIVDEASMINASLMRDLESFPVKALYVGDHGQLEPIGDDPGLMMNPDVKLEQVHRQAAGSPIIQLAHDVRTGRDPRSFGESAVVVDRIPNGIHRFDIVLCGRNDTRCTVNARIRYRRGFEGPIPHPGERVMCLRNNKDYGIFNGMQATVVQAALDGKYLHMIVRFDDGEVSQAMTCLLEQFGRPRTLRDADYKLALWDWGYASTVHKAQGSEWDNVLVLEQILGDWSVPRWRYTAITRAANSVVYVKRRAA